MSERNSLMNVPRYQAKLYVERRASDRENIEVEMGSAIECPVESVACHILNLSQHGAKIELMDEYDLPGELKFYVPVTKTQIECRVIWQNNKQAGLEFVEPLD